MTKKKKWPLTNKMKRKLIKFVDKVAKLRKKISDKDLNVFTTSFHDKLVVLKSGFFDFSLGGTWFEQTVSDAFHVTLIIFCHDIYPLQ